MSYGKKAIWMQGMYGAYRAKFLKIQINYIGRHKMMAQLFLIILSISVLKRINKNCLISAKRLMEEMILFNKLIVHFLVLKVG